jgi:hypothetical protein
MIRSILDDFLILSLRQILEKMGAGVKPTPNGRKSLVAAAARFAGSLWLSF